MYIASLLSSKNLGFKGGISLAFVSYPSAVLEMEVSPLWSFLFFFMLINLALSSICGGMQTFLAFIIDEKPSLKKYQTWILVGLCILFFCAGLPMVNLTTCFHEFSKLWIYEFFYQLNIMYGNAHKWCPIFFVIFCDTYLPTFVLFCPIFSYIPKIGHPTLANIPKTQNLNFGD